MTRSLMFGRPTRFAIAMLATAGLFLMGADGGLPGLTVASLFTAAGAGIAALAIRQVIEVIKGVFPAIDERVSGAAQAFTLSALLYIYAAIALPIDGPDGFLAAILTWLACATAAVGIDQVGTRVAETVASKDQS